MKRFILAGREHDEGLRALLCKNAMGEGIRLSLRREPSFFLAEEIGNIRSQVITVLDDEGRVIGCGSRAVREMYVDGVMRAIGYLSQLRSLPSVRGNIFLAKAYRFLRALDRLDPEIPFSMTTILDDNPKVKEVLESGRAGLPTYLPIATLVSSTIPLSGTKKEEGSVKRVMHAEELSEILGRANAWSRRHLFGPHYAADRLEWLTHVKWVAYQLDVDDCAGTMIICDLSSVKQIVVEKYGGLFRIMRPFANVGLALAGKSGFPPPGSHIPLVYAFACSFEGNEERALLRLLSAVREDWQRKANWLELGCDAKHPLLPVLAREALVNVPSTLYAVGWDKQMLVSSVRPELVHVDVGSL